VFGKQVLDIKGLTKAIEAHHNYILPSSLCVLLPLF